MQFCSRQDGPWKPKEWSGHAARFKIVLCVRDANHRMRWKWRRGWLQRWGLHAERGSLKSNLRPRRMRRSRPVRYFLARGWHANRFRSPLRDDADYDDDDDDENDDNVVAAADDDDIGPTLEAPSDCNSCFGYLSVNFTRYLSKRSSCEMFLRLTSQNFDLYCQFSKFGKKSEKNKIYWDLLRDIVFLTSRFLIV